MPVKAGARERRVASCVRGAIAWLDAKPGRPWYAGRVGGTWYLIFRAASGDCPSGCIDEQFFFFAVSDGAVMPGDPEAELFRRLLAERGWGP